MKQETLGAVPGGEFNHIYELGKLSGEVKVLKWGAALVVTMIFAYLTFLSQQITGLRTDMGKQISEVRTSLEQQVGEVRKEVSALKEGQSIIRERLGVIEQRVTGMDQHITTNKLGMNTRPHL